MVCLVAVCCCPPRLDADLPTPVPLVTYPISNSPFLAMTPVPVEEQQGYLGDVAPPWGDLSATSTLQACKTQMLARLSESHHQIMVRYSGSAPWSNAIATHTVTLLVSLSTGSKVLYLHAPEACWIPVSMQSMQALTFADLSARL